MADYDCVVPGTWETKRNYEVDMMYTEEKIKFKTFNMKFPTLDAEVKTEKEETTNVEVLYRVKVNKKQLDVTSRYQGEEDEGEVISCIDITYTDEFLFDFKSLATHEGCQNQLHDHLQHLVATNIVSQQFWDIIDDDDFAKVIELVALEGLGRRSKKIETILEVEVLTVKWLPPDDDEIEFENQTDEDCLAPTVAASVAQLGKTEFNDDGEQELEDKDCSICLRKYCSGVKIVHMPCKHLFHEECILRWLNQASTCPLCRHQMPINSPERRYEES